MEKNKLFILRSSEANRIIVAGDIHGDYATFRKICSLFSPRRDYLIFLGDYADRGNNGLGVIYGVKGLIEKYPSRVIALKGNHEDYSDDGRPKFYPCTLLSEVFKNCKTPWSNFFRDELKIFINMLYLAALLPGEVLFVHGGVSTKIRNGNDLQFPLRSIERDVLWSDPYEGHGEEDNVRGAGILFGRNVSKTVCQKLEINRIIRSHQPTKALKGPFFEHGGRVITISSTSVYGGKPHILILPTHHLSEAINNFKGSGVYFT